MSANKNQSNHTAVKVTAVIVAILIIVTAIFVTICLTASSCSKVDETPAGTLQEEDPNDSGSDTDGLETSTNTITPDTTTQETTEGEGSGDESGDEKDESGNNDSTVPEDQNSNTGDDNGDDEDLDDSGDGSDPEPEDPETEDTDPDDSDDDDVVESLEGEFFEEKVTVETKRIVQDDISSLSGSLANTSSYVGSYYATSEETTTDELAKTVSVKYTMLDYDKDESSFADTELYIDSEHDYVNRDYTSSVVIFAASDGTTSAYQSIVDYLDESNSSKTACGDSLSDVYVLFTGEIGTYLSIPSSMGTVSADSLEAFMKLSQHFPYSDDLEGIKDQLLNDSTSVLGVYRVEYENSDKTGGLYILYEYSAKFEVEGYSVLYNSITTIGVEDGYVIMRMTDEEITISDSEGTIVYYLTYIDEVHLTYESNPEYFDIDTSEYESIGGETTEPEDQTDKELPEDPGSQTDGDATETPAESEGQTNEGNETDSDNQAGEEESEVPEDNEGADDPAGSTEPEGEDET